MATLITSYYADSFVNTIELSQYYSVKQVVKPIALGAGYAASITANVNAIVDAVNALPAGEKWALAGFSGGAWICSLVADKMASGQPLAGRAADFLGATVGGNPRRKAGTIFPGGTDPGGHGIVNTGRMTTIPAGWWEFADPNDIIASVGDDTNGTLIQSVFAWMYANYTGDAAGLYAAAAAQFSSTPAAQLNAILQLVYTGFTWAWPHMTYILQRPIAGDDRNTMQVATDYLKGLALSSPKARTVIALGGNGGDLSGALAGDLTRNAGVVQFPYNAWQLFPSGPTFEAAIDNLNSTILNTLATTAGPVTVAGFDTGSAIISGWLGKYGNTSTASATRVQFVLLGNPVRKDGGVLVNSVASNRLVPDNTPYRVLDISKQYDGWSDWPTKIPPPNLSSLWTSNPSQIFESLRQLGTQAGQNALLGMSRIHGNGYRDFNLEDEHYSAYVGNIEYRLYSTATPPLVATSYPFALEGYLSQRSSERKPMIEVKYSRLVPVPQIAPGGGIRTREDAERLWQNVLNRRKRREKERLKPPKIRLFDGGGVLRGEVAGWRSVKYSFIENDTGTCGLRLGLDHYLSKWVMNFRGRAKRNVHIVIDKQGTRWNGFMDTFTVKKEKGGDKYLDITFKHDFEQAKHVLCWANPFLRPEVQFPKVWTIFGPAKWCLLMTLFVNLFRLETSLWTLPDNPLDINEWVPFSFNPGTWRNLVKPFPLLGDNSPITVVFSRFKSWFDVAQKQLKDSQLTVVCKRYIKGEDEHPFSDLKGELDVDYIEDLFKLIPIRNFALIWDIVDNSEWGTETSFGGSFLTGLTRAAVQIADDGTTEGVDVFTGSPTYPGEYYQPGWMGTNPKVPHVVFLDGTYTGIEESEFTYYEATDTSFVGGGESMPGVNEAISAGVNMAGDFFTSIINSLLAPGGAFGAAIDLPPLGGIMDSVAKIFYENTFLAWMEVPTLRAAGQTLPLPGLESTETGLGDFHLFEGLAEGATRAFTLSMLMAIRAKIWSTRARTAHKIKVADAAPYYVGENGKGHFFLGSRVGTTFKEYTIPDTIFVERVTQIDYEYDSDGPKGWTLTIGYEEPKDPAFKALEDLRELNAGLGQWGIL